MTPPAIPERDVLSVTALNFQIRAILEGQFPSVWVAGEVSNFTHHSSGHMYLTLKDSRSQLSTVIYRAVNARLKFAPRDGMQVIVQGRLSVHEPHGKYQFLVEHLEPQGIGAAELALRQLKEKLFTQGYFDRKRKRPLHPYPRRVAIVTSGKGAAIRDMLELFANRWPSCEVIVRPCRVQGEGAAEDVASSVRLLSQLHASKRLQFHAIIVGRGGGSTEDLMAFNAEIVADAIFECSVPVISAVGHEIDVTIADHVADHRAETPSAAVVLLTPQRHELLRNFANLNGQLRDAVQRRIEIAKERVDQAASRPTFRRPLQRFSDLEQRLDDSADRLQRAAKVRLATASKKIESLAARLETLSPLNVLRRGYSLTRTVEGKLLRDAAEVQPGDLIVTRVQNGEVTSRVEQS